MTHRLPSRTVGPVERTRERRAQPRSALVARPRLLQRLDLVLARGLACVVAPAGFGKTTLVRSWVLEHARHTGSGAVEVTLPGGSPEDGDDQAMLCRWWWHDSSPESTSTSILPPAPELDGTTFEDGSVVDVLVVDDAHLLRAAVLAEVLAWLRDNPARARLVLISRWGQTRQVSKARLPDPPIELRAEDLRFSLAEGRELLRTRVGTAADGHEAALLERTSGWIAGLRLAAAGLEQAVRRSERSGEEPRAAAREFVLQFSGDDRAVADFLIVEVLSSMPHRDLAVLAAVCGRRSGPLSAPLPPVVVSAAEVLVRTRDLGLRGADAIETLNRFAESELFVLVSGENWRLHPLLVATVRGLVATTPALITAAERGHVAAARWQAARGYPVAAVGEAVGSRQPELVADLLLASGPEIILTEGAGAQELFAAAFDALGADWPARFPQLLALSALRRVVAQDLAGAARTAAAAGTWARSAATTPEHRDAARSDLAVVRLLLARAGMAPVGTTLDEVSAEVLGGGPDGGSLRAPAGLLRDALLLTSLGELALCEGRWSEGGRHVRAVLQMAGLGEPGVDGSAAQRCLGLRASALAVLAGVGDRDRFAQLTARWEDSHNPQAHALAGTVLGPMPAVRLARAVLAWKIEQPHQAVLELARADAGAPGTDPLFPALRAAARAWLAVVCGDPAHAVAEVAEVRATTRPGVVPAWLAVAFVGVVLAAARSPLAPDPCDDLLEESLQVLDGLDLEAPGVAAALRTVETRLLGGPSEGGPEDGRASLRRLGEATRAERLVRRRRDGALRAAVPDRQARAGALPAGHAAAPRGGRVMEPGRRVEASGTRQPAATTGTARTVQPSRAATAGRPTTAGAPLGLTVSEVPRPAPSQAALAEPLTPRELEILRRLDSPAHYDHIAEALFLSRNTVKTHVKAVYRKLGVNGRVDAVRVALELGLLDPR